MLWAIAWSQSTSIPILSLLVWLPATGMCCSYFTRNSAHVFWVGIGITLLECLLALYLLQHFDQGTPHLQFFEQLQLGSLFAYQLGVDGLNILFVLLTSLLCLLILLYGELLQERQPGRYVALILAMETVLMGQFLSLNLVQFWLFAVLETLPLSNMLLIWGTGQHKRQATRKYLQFMAIGLALLGSSFILLGWSHAMTTGQWSFNWLELFNNPVKSSWQGLIFVLLFYGFASRLALFPFHAWLPLIAEQGTLATAGMFLVGIKVGIYALLRFLLPLLPLGVEDNYNLVIGMALLSIIYGALMALMQINLRRLLAFAAISHTGMLVIGAFGLNHEGMAGTLLLTITFGMAASGLLFAIGVIKRRALTTQLPRLGGLFDLMPLLGITFLIATLSTMAMPGTPGFDAAHLMLEGALETHHTSIAVILAVGSVLSASFLLWAFQRAFLAPRREQRLHTEYAPLTLKEVMLASIVCAVLLGVGFYIEPWLDTIETSTKYLAQRYSLITEH